MNKPKHIIALVLVLQVAVAFYCAAEGRVARITQGIFLYSNWDVPYLTLDTCLDMTITEATIPDTVTWYGRKYPVVEIGQGAFLDCPNLKVIKIGRKEPPALENNHPFYRCSWDEVIEPYHTLSTVIVVPEGCEDAYRKAPGWKEFKVTQSHVPDGTELQIDEIDVQINNLESELRRTQEKERRLLIEIEVLRRTKATNY